MCCSELTVTKKIVDVHFTRMHCGRKSLKNKLTYVDKPKKRFIFFVLLKFYGPRCIVFQSFLLDARNAFL